MTAGPVASPSEETDSQPRRIMPADVAHLPSPGGAIPVAITFSPDGRSVTFLQSGDRSLSRSLEALEVASGRRWTVVGSGAGNTEDELSAEEKLRRERARELGVGVTRYLRARRANTLLVPRADGLWVHDDLTSPGRLVVGATGGPPLDPQLAPDGRSVSFVRDGEVHVAEVASGQIRTITRGADPDAGVTHGLAEFVAQEEMGREHGYWWSRDGQWLAWAEVDESPIPPFRIMHPAHAEPGAAAEEVHRYPFAGAANARVRLAVSPAAGGDPVWLDLGDDDCYLARVHWMPDGTLMAEVEQRDQMRLDLWRFDPATGSRHHVLTEESDVWVNLHHLFRPLDAGGFVWGSERSGFRHLLLCDDDGRVVRPLTAGDWQVDSVDGIDQEGGVVFFSATEASPLERHLYAVPLTGGAPRRITTAPGTHQVVVDDQGRSFVDTFSALDTPWSVCLRSLASGDVVHTIYDEIDPRIAELGLEPPRLFTVHAAGGGLLHGAVYPPGEAAGTRPGPFPTVVSVYGGPHAQRVTNSWTMTADLRAQLLRQAGFCVVVLDNRGSARRGLAFEGAIRHRLGELEIDDQIAGVQWAVDAGLTDPRRVGIYGWSYGGYLSAMALARAPGVFRAAVAGAPVTSWDGYDTHYTERYMSTPQANPEGYRTSSVMTHAPGITGRLLLVHGLIDENVHFRHTARLMQTLINEGRTHELMLFPEERHVPRHEKDRAYMESRILAFLLDALGGSHDG